MPLCFAWCLSIPTVGSVLLPGCHIEDDGCQSLSCLVLSFSLPSTFSVLDWPPWPLHTVPSHHQSRDTHILLPNLFQMRFPLSDELLNCLTVENMWFKFIVLLIISYLFWIVTLFMTMSRRTDVLFLLHLRSINTPWWQSKCSKLRFKVEELSNFPNMASCTSTWIATSTVEWAISENTHWRLRYCRWKCKLIAWRASHSTFIPLLELKGMLLNILGEIKDFSNCLKTFSQLLTLVLAPGSLIWSKWWHFCRKYQCSSGKKDRDGYERYKDSLSGVIADLEVDVLHGALQLQRQKHKRKGSFS